MPTANTISLQNLIYQQALASGVPPQIALAVAQQESGTSQWTQSGNLVTGSSGEIGVFQLMPGTAAGLGVDPTDVNQNIQGGVSFLAQLFNKYGNWAQALSAYNSGSPTGSPGYANSVLSIANGIGLPAASDVLSGDSGASATDGSGIPLTVIAGAALAAVGLILWALD
jgi:soluble lytic murein transglycosylase-like protein